MRILHLAYEDPHQPGSGGGSVRTHEINRRLGARHEITALVAGYPGATIRQEGGVRWKPLHPRTGTKIDRLAYFGALPAAIRAHPHDLLVEDFSAPFGPGFSPLFTRQPVVASVQWLFAAHMRAKYHLPFDTVEQFGLRFYHDFIVVSDWVGNRVRARCPESQVETIPNGIEPLAFTPRAATPRHFLFVGRLDRQQKGGDLLLDSIARTVTLLGKRMPPLLIAGDGPDRATMEQHAARLGITHLVQFLGRVEGEAKYRLMANAHALLMPSRFETFGMVAVEAQAAGTPVVAFDVGPLASVAGGGGAQLVPAFDVEAFAQSAATLITDTVLNAKVRQQGRAWARQYDWDSLAERQEQHYLAAIAAAKTGHHRLRAATAHTPPLTKAQRPSRDPNPTDTGIPV